MENKEEVISFNREILNNPNIRAFSVSDGDKATYIISLDSKNGEVQKHEDRIALAKFELGTGTLRELTKGIIKLLESVANGKTEKSTVDYDIEQLKKINDISFTPEMLEILSICTDKDKRNLEQISVTRETKIEELIPDTSLDYKKMDTLLPTQEKIDLSNVPDETIQDLGSKAQNRLDILDSIKSGKDAKAYKDSLESFMEYQEVGTDREKILLHLIEKIDSYDPNTIIETLKAIEDKDIKYSKLYPIYLRIQEKRIITKVQMYLIGLKSKEAFPDGQLEKFLESLDEQKIEDLADTDLNSVISNFISNENKDLEKYLKGGRKTDFEMIRYINSQEETGARANEKEEVLDYLKSRAASLRQVGKDFAKFEFRSYIEDTDFKDPDETEQNEFLYAVAEIEKKVLIERYDELIKSKEHQDKPKSLSEYDTELTKEEQTKAKAEQLYQEYTALVNGTMHKDNKDNKNKETGEKD